MDGSRHNSLRHLRFAAPILAGLALLAALSGSVIGADLCIVPVKNGEPTQADLGQTFRMVHAFTTFPGVGRPIIPGFNRRGVWTIDKDRAFVPYGGSFPSWGMDAQYAFDQRENRIVGINGRGVFVADPDDSVFKPIENVNPDGRLWFSTIAYIHRTGQILIGSNKGLMLLSGNTLLPAGGGDSDSTASIVRIFDLPLAGGLALSTGDQRILIRSDEGATTEAYVLERRRRVPFPALGDGVMEVAEFPSPNALLIRSYAETIVLRLRKGARGIEADQVQSLQYFTVNRGYDGSIDLLSLATSSYVVYGRVPDDTSRNGELNDRTRADIWRFERLKGASFEPVPGWERLPTQLRRLVDLPMHKIVLLMSSRYLRAKSPLGNGGLFAFDGTTIAPVDESDAASIGDNVDVYHLPSIGKVLLISERGLFELRSDLSVRAIETPPGFTFGLPVPEIAEMPASRTALILGQAGVFSLGTDGIPKPVRGAEHYEDTFNRNTAGIIPRREELLLVGRKGLVLAVDEAIAGPGSCN